jgi:hypothetical protein
MARNFVSNILVTEDEIAGMLNQIPQKDQGEAILHLCHRLNEDMYSRMHKGLMFYFMGIAAYRINAFSLAIYYIDAAVSEDLRNEPDNYNSPSKLFLRLQGDEDKQAAKELVQDAQGRIENHINHYNERINTYALEFPRLTITDIRKYLLEKASLSNQPDIRSLATTFITFFSRIRLLFLSTYGPQGNRN